MICGYELQGTFISQRDIVARAAHVIDESGYQIAIVVDERNTLIGVVTDGDIRRSILCGGALSRPVSEIMSKNPLYCRENSSKEEILGLMNKHEVGQVVVVDKDQVVIGLETMMTILKVKKHDNLVVIMAGGLGSRLGDLTKEVPKPLLRVGGKPILETIISRLKSHGFYRIKLAVNYKAEKIKEYFGDGSQLGVDITYIDECKRLGTCGALSLIDEECTQPVLLMNGDVLTNINYSNLLYFHNKSGALATMCVREYSFQVQFGVVKTNGEYIVDLSEKPTQSFMVNAGIYVLNGEMLRKIPKDSYYDSTTLFKEFISENSKVAAFPLREYWIDIGQKTDYEKAESDYLDIFCK